MYLAVLTASQIERLSDTPIGAAAVVTVAVDADTL
jgi:hypothetical protein